MKKQIYNPYLPSYEYIPDGEPHVWGDRLYLYGSHDRFGGSTYCENDYVCWSAPVDDLSDWRYEGVIYQKTQHPYQCERKELFAPDVARGVDDRYYLYYSVAHSSVISVAVCSTPAGHYEYLGDISSPNGQPLGKLPGDLYQFDPAVLVDDDGRVYLYSGFNPAKEKDVAGRIYAGCHVTELESDMLTVKKGPVIVIPRDQNTDSSARYFEAPSIRKYHDIYYLVYSVRCAGLHYYYSKYPDHGFQYGGCLHSTSDVGLHGHTIEQPAYPVGNTHGGLVLINDQYYIFDHRLTNNSSYCRQGVAEPVTMDEHGLFHQAESTSCGLNQGPLAGTGTYPAYIACNLIDQTQYSTKEDAVAKRPRLTQDGEDRETMPGQYLSGMHDKCIVGYKYFQIDDIDHITLTLRGQLNGRLTILLQENSYVAGSIPVLMDETSWSDIPISVKIPSGKHAIFIQYEGSGSFDLLKFTLQ